MAGNTFGTLFKLTTFGESHGVAIGGVLDGCPSGIEIDLDAIAHNVRLLAKIAAPSRLYAIVKANAYGPGVLFRRRDASKALQLKACGR